MRLRLDVLVRRGPIPEARHVLEAAVVDHAGAVRGATGGAAEATSFRSAAKPFQLLPLVERGHADRFGLGPEDLALMAASHSGSEYHVARAAALLGRLGLDPSHLECGVHDPFDAAMLARIQRGEIERGPLHHNCSGKHAGMLALALAEGWPTKGYIEPAHPVQRLMLRTLAEVAGLDPAAIATGVDGCGVVAFGLSLTAMARAYAALAAADPAGSPRERALARIRDAMMAHPVATAGAGRFSTELMQAVPGAIVSKVGAEGLECMALPGRRLGVAVKCADGASRAVPPAALALLDHLGALSSGAMERLAKWRRPVVLNHAGREAGHLEAVLAVAAPPGP
jgi:L-asparaginase II